MGEWWDVFAVMIGLFLLLSFGLIYLMALISHPIPTIVLTALGYVVYRGWRKAKSREEWTKIRDELISKEKFEREQVGKGLVKFVDRHGNERWLTPKQAVEWRITDMDLRNNFAGLTPREFERLIADLFKEMGYKAELTPKTADYGADMVARKGGDTIVIEVCKYRVGHNVSNREVQSCGTVRSYTMRSSNTC